MSIYFIAIHSYILKYVAFWGQNTLRGTLHPTLPYLHSSKAIGVLSEGKQLRVVCFDNYWMVSSCPNWIVE